MEKEVFVKLENSLKTKLGEGALPATLGNLTHRGFEVSAESLPDVCHLLMTEKEFLFDYLSCISGIDNGSERNTMAVVYHLYSIPFGHTIMLKVIVGRSLEEGNLPVVPSLASLWKSANWMEREVYDMFGIQFSSHPDLRRILLPADWQGYPLRKDYNTQDYYHGIKVDY